MEEHNPKEFWKLVKSIKPNNSNNIQDEISPLIWHDYLKNLNEKKVIFENSSETQYTTFKKARLSGGILIKRTEARLVGHTRDCASMNMAGASSSCVLSEEDIPGASLNGRKPAELKNDDLKFWLKCRGDFAKGLKTKAQLIKRYHLWP